MAATTGQFPAETSADGAFVRQPYTIRDRITADGSSGFRAEPGRYHLYVSLACPWAHRTVILRRLKGLEDVVSLSIADPIRDERGWAFTGGAYTEQINGFGFLAEAYAATDLEFHGRISVPVLWDRQDGRIVNNESADIIRMLNRFSDDGPDLYPEPLRPQIDAFNERIYSKLNNGVYRAGFASSQEAYRSAYEDVFETLDWLEEHLAEHRYLASDDEPTEADWRLFTTLLRFDAVYVGHFKCNRNRLIDMPNLWGLARELYQWPGVAETVDLAQIKSHYYATHKRLNPTGIVPEGPRLDFTTPHGRERLGSRAS